MKLNGPLTFLIGSALIWGTSFPVVELNLRFLGMNFYVLFIFRYLVAVISSSVIIILYKKVHDFFTIARDYKVVLLGLLNMLTIVVAYLGQALTFSGKASLLINLNMIYVAFLAVFFFKEKLDKFKISGIILGIIGAYFLTIGFDFDQLFSGSITGDILMLVAGLIWAFYVILMKRIYNSNENSKNFTPLLVSHTTFFYGFVFGLIPFIFLILLAPDLMLMPDSLYSWVSILYLGLICTTLAYFLYNKGLQKKSAVLASIILLIEVLTANLIGMFFLPNQAYFTLDFLLGAIFVIAAILISCLKQGS
jgi:drug/metabolite transporter (DMT)-like permease